jgi:hypothetical protein
MITAASVRLARSADHDWEAPCSCGEEILEGRGVGSAVMQGIGECGADKRGAGRGIADAFAVDSGVGE